MISAEPTFMVVLSRYSVATTRLFYRNNLPYKSQQQPACALFKVRSLSTIVRGESPSKTGRLEKLYFILICFCCVCVTVFGCP